MATFMYVQVRQIEGVRTVIAWPMDVEEAFCETSSGVIVVGTDRCREHADAENPCPSALRTPPECKHPSVDVSDTSAPACRTCGLVGADGTAYLKNVPPPSDVPLVPEAT